MKASITSEGLKPIVRRIAISVLLSITIMMREERMLNAATKMIRKSITVIIRFSVETAEKSSPFSVRQSLTLYPAGSSGENSETSKGSLSQTR